jgi:hypothetical protein
MDILSNAVFPTPKRAIRVGRCLMSLRRIAKMPAGHSKKAILSTIVHLTGVATGGMLLDATRFPAAAASAQGSPSPGDLIGAVESYLYQSEQWVRISIDSTLRAYHLDANEFYMVGLTLFILAIFVCLMIKAFTLGKQAANRPSRDR